MKRFLISLFAFVLLLGITPLFSQAEEKREKAIVEASVLNVRESPSPNAKIIGKLQKGTVTYIYARKPGGWAEIRYDNRVAFAAAAYLKVVNDTEEANGKKAIVHATSLNVREYPSPKAKIIGSLANNSITYIQSVKPGGWAEIRYNGKPAYVALQYLQVVSPYEWTGEYLGKLMSGNHSGIKLKIKNQNIDTFDFEISSYSESPLTNGGWGNLKTEMLAKGTAKIVDDIATYSQNGCEITLTYDNSEIIANYGTCSKLDKWSNNTGNVDEVFAK